MTEPMNGLAAPGQLSSVTPATQSVPSADVARLATAFTANARNPNVLKQIAARFARFSDIFTG